MSSQDQAETKKPSWVDPIEYNASEAYDKIVGDKEKQWLKSQTGIQDDAELKKHAIAVQEEAWKVCLAPKLCSESR